MADSPPLLPSGHAPGWLLAVLVIAMYTASTSCEDVSTAPQKALQWDTNGYLFFCLCMGRFGNQAAHFLGGLAMAKRVDRTLVLPPWNDGRLAPFDEWFKVEEVAKYHRVITAKQFMEKLAPTHWPEAERVGMCYQFPGHKGKPCVMDDSDHHFWFWRDQGVTFVRSEPYFLPFVAAQERTAREWDERFPPSRYPVVALRGAPAQFPLAREHNALHRHLVWSDDIAAERDRLIAEHLTPAGGPFISVHIRNAQDWVNTCDLVGDVRGSSLMAAAQCVGHEAGVGTVTRDMCLPSRDSIARHAAEAAARIGAAAVYVATADDPMLAEIRAAVGPRVRVVHLAVRPQLDLAVMAAADHFVGNCVSSFSAFVRQERDVAGRPSSFFNHGASHLSPTVHDDL